jgi:hypothetical protein
VRNWLDTSPRTWIGASSFKWACQCAAVDSQAFPGSQSGNPVVAGRPPDHQSGARACGHARKTKSPPITASAAVSGRMAVPALPMNRSACDTIGSCPPCPQSALCAVLLQLATQLRAGQSSMTRVSSESSRSCTVVRAAAQGCQQQTPGWRCSWSPAGSGCHQRSEVAGCHGNESGAQSMPGRVEQNFAFMRHLARVVLAWAIRAFKRLGISAGDHQGFKAPATAFESDFGFGPATRRGWPDQDVTPDLGVAGRDAGEVAKTRAGQRQILLALRFGWPAMTFISANASRCGRWLTAAKAASWASGDMVHDLAAQGPIPDLAGLLQLGGQRAFQSASG